VTEEDRLEQYRAMRDFRRTPEPAGTQPGPVGEPVARFVVQEHHATSLHWDLRLERDGVLVSWAVPKGIPADPRRNHLAVHTEDHPLEYLDFAGDIPAGSYGGGGMAIWDRGTYTTQKFGDREVMVTFAGERTRGRYVLFQTGGNQWMIHRMDPPEDPSRELMPTEFRLMTAVDGDLPEGAGWAFEFDWPGARLAVAVEGGRCRSATVAGAPATGIWPELAPFGRAVGSLPVAVDLVAVTLGADGRPDPSRLARRRAGGSESAVRRLARQAPATLLLVDLLWLDGHPVTGLPYHDRRHLLSGLGLEAPGWRTPSHHDAHGAAVLAAAADQGLPGVVAKQSDSLYLAGPSDDWVRVPAGDRRPNAE
jgi:bifunctional non-homologous end joining protein LigD